MRKARDVMPILERVKRSTGQMDVLTICEELEQRLVREMANRAESSAPHVSLGLGKVKSKRKA